MGKNITKTAVDSLSYSEGPASQNMIWDTGTGSVGGFGVRVRATGKKYYFIKYRFKGRQRWYTIGRHGSPWTVEKGRKKANKILEMVEDGIDPIGEKEKEKGIPILDDFADDYLKKIESGEIRTSRGLPKKPSTIATDKIRITNYIKPLMGKFRLDAITKQDVEAFRDKVLHGKGLAGSKSSGGPGAASRTLGLLSAILSQAKTKNIIKENPALGVPGFRAGKRERFLSVEEFKRLGEALAKVEKTKSEGAYPIAAIRLLLFTGCRRGEILNLKWSEVDLERKILNIGDAKTLDRKVYLNSPAIEVLEGISKTKSNPYVLCGKVEKQPLVNISKAWQRIRKQARLEDVRLHDLRHSFASVGAMAGVPLLVLGKLLGHTQTATTERYAHLAADPVRDAGEEMAKAIKRALEGGGNAAK